MNHSLLLCTPPSRSSIWYYYCCKLVCLLHCWPLWLHPEWCASKNDRASHADKSNARCSATVTISSRSGGGGTGATTGRIQICIEKRPQIGWFSNARACGVGQFLLNLSARHVEESAVADHKGVRCPHGNISGFANVAVFSTRNGSDKDG